MKDVRIGNDIAVRWSLTKDGGPFDLTGLPLTLYLKSMYGKSKVEDFSVKDNSIEWTFWGKDQKNTGVYSLVLVANEGVEGMMTTDACDFVHLVPCSCKISDREDSCGVETETIEVQSEVEFFSGASIEVDTTLSPNSPNPIANFAVHNEFERVWDKIDSSQVVTFDSLTDAEKIKEVFNHWHLEKFLKQPISCYIKEEGNEETYQIATLIVEKYDSDYKLNFITFNATSQFKEYDENGEDMGYYNPEWQWSAKSRLINGICNSYLIQSSGYVMHLGKGALIIADEALDATSERPVSNKALCEALENIKIFEVVDSLPDEGEDNKVYLVADRIGDTTNLHIEWVWIDGRWEQLGLVKKDGSGNIILGATGGASINGRDNLIFGSRPNNTTEVNDSVILGKNINIDDYALLENATIIGQGHRISQGAHPNVQVYGRYARLNTAIAHSESMIFVVGDGTNYNEEHNAIYLLSDGKLVIDEDIYIKGISLDPSATDASLAKFITITREMANGGGFDINEEDTAFLMKMYSLLMGAGQCNAYVLDGNKRIPCACKPDYATNRVTLSYVTYKNGYLVEATYVLDYLGNLSKNINYLGKKFNEQKTTSQTIRLDPNQHVKITKSDYDSCTISLQVGLQSMYEEYSVEYNASEVAVQWPEDIRWENRTPPTSNAGSTYLVRIVRSWDSYFGSFTEYPRPFITFTIDSNEVQGEQGMTWDEWIGSSYNTVGATLSSDGFIMVDEKLVVIENTLIASSETIVSGTNYELQTQMSNEEKLVGTYNHSATSTGGATLGTAYLPTIAMDSSGNFTMSSLLGNSSSGPVASATYDDTAKTFTVKKGWTHPMFGPVDTDIVFDVDFTTMTLTAQSNFTVGGWATISGYKLVKKA